MLFEPLPEGKVAGFQGWAPADGVEDSGDREVFHFHGSDGCPNGCEVVGVAAGDHGEASLFCVGPGVVVHGS